MTKYEVKKGNEESDQGDDVDLAAMPPRDPIEPADTDPKPGERPDLDWAEHED